jgi:iron complex outermembrane receptor protein
VNVFASYSESFRPQRGVARDAAGNIFKRPPQTGEGTDFGVKFDILDGRLSGTISYFDITVRDIMSREQPPAGGTAYDIVIDGRKVDGWEFDGIWQAGNNQLILSYARVSGESLGDETGQRVPGLPQDRFAVWNKYSFRKGALKGSFVAAGYSYTADRLIGQNNNFFINDASYDVWDLAVGYDTRWRDVGVEFRINVKNVLDEEYLVPGGDGGSFFWGDPRMVYFSTRLTF